MEEKIYERQVTKETLSQRVIDEHQIDRHFTAADLRELYVFKPDRLDDPTAPKRTIPSVPKVCFRFGIHCQDRCRRILELKERSSILTLLIWRKLLIGF